MFKHFLLPVALFTFLLDTPGLQAQELPELDLIRGLRKRGWHDLALERLEKLQARTQPPLPADWKLVIPLEFAKTRAAMASKVEDPADRDRLIDKTRQDLEGFIKTPANAQNPALPEAYLDLARLTSERGNAKAATARFAADAAQSQAETKAALDLFTAADTAFKEAVKRLEEAYKKVEDSKNAAVRQAALELYLDALYQHGMTLWQMSEVYPKDEAKGGEALKGASKAFDTMAGFRDKPEAGLAAITLAWQAYAWYGRTVMDLEQTKGQAAYQRIERERKPEVALAQRLVRYFKIVSSFRSNASVAVRMPVQAEAEKWLKEYPTSVNSPEGQHIRYLLGLMYLDELDDEKNPQKKNAPAYQALVARATDHLTALEKVSTRFAGAAQNLKVRVRYVSGQALTTAIPQLKNFEDCILRADHELREAEEALKKTMTLTTDNDKELARKTAQSHYQNLLDAIRRGLSMMPDNVKDEQWDHTYLLLYTAYWRLGDQARAVVTLDHLARHTKKPDDAKKRLGVVLDMYSRHAEQNDDTYARKQIVLLSSIVEQRWPNEPEADKARDIVGFDLYRQKEFREAATMLAKVTEKHGRFGLCSFWAGRIFWILHFQAMKEAKKGLATPSPDRDQAVALLSRCIKALDGKKAEGGEKILIDAKVGLAEIYNQLGQTDDVLKTIAPLVTSVEQKKLPQDLAKGTDTQILGLALRSYIQKKDITSAVRVLDVLQKQGSQEDIGQGLREHLVSLGKQIKAEIDSLSQQGPAAADRLAATKDSFRQFLGHLEKDPKLTGELLMWVGTNYAGLADHARAAELFAKINAATPAGHAQCNLSALLAYHAAVRQLAAAEPDKNRKEELFKKADAELTKAMAAADKIKKHPAFIKEAIHLKQERGLLSGANGAITAWDKLRTALEPHIQNSAQLKSVYLDATYYLVWCLYQEARQIQNPTVRKDALDRAAAKLKAFQQIEELKPRFDELLLSPQHRDLKDAYDKLGRAAAR